MLTQLPLVEPPVFLLGIGHESPLQQHDAAPSLPLQQACAFLWCFVFLQQDMSLSPALQQSFTSQQAPSWVVFCGVLRVIAAVETAKAAVQAKLIKSSLNFFIIASPN